MLMLAAVRIPVAGFSLSRPPVAAARGCQRRDGRQTAMAGNQRSQSCDDTLLDKTFVIAPRGAQLVALPLPLPLILAPTLGPSPSPTLTFPLNLKLTLLQAHDRAIGPATQPAPLVALLGAVESAGAPVSRRCRLMPLAADNGQGCVWPPGSMGVASSAVTRLRATGAFLASPGCATIKKV